VHQGRMLRRTPCGCHTVANRDRAGEAVLEHERLHGMRSYDRTTQIVGMLTVWLKHATQAHGAMERTCMHSHQVLPMVQPVWFALMSTSTLRPCGTQPPVAPPRPPHLRSPPGPHAPAAGSAAQAARSAASTPRGGCPAGAPRSCAPAWHMVRHHRRRPHCSAQAALQHTQQARQAERAMSKASGG